MGKASICGRMLVAKERRKPVSNNMGWTAQIANPLKVIRWEIRGKIRAGSSAPCRKQRIGGSAMGGGLVAMCCHTGDFGVEQSDPVIEFGLRIGAEILVSEATRRVSAGPGTIGFFHWDAASGGSGLLSIGETVIRAGTMVNGAG